jgi:hypothetical protein
MSNERSPQKHYKAPPGSPWYGRTVGDIATFVKCNEGDQSRMTGVANAPLLVQQLVTRGDRFKELKNIQKNQRLHSALMDVFGR